MVIVRVDGYPAKVELEILIIARGSRSVWPAAGWIRVEPFEIFKSRVRVRIEIILSGADAGQPNLSRGYPPTRKLKKSFFFEKKNIFRKIYKNTINIYIILIINILF